MAVRYSGSVRISVLFRDVGDYRCVVSYGLERRVVFVGPPACGYGEGIAYDSPKAYDQVAHAALSFASEECSDFEDVADLDSDGAGWLISRRKPVGSV